MSDSEGGDEAPDSGQGTDPEEGRTRTIYIAKWETRFWAWLVDVILVSALVNVFGGLLGPVPLVLNVDLAAVGDLGIYGGFNGVGLFLYWTVLEGATGQSAGKRVLDLRVTDRSGNPAGYVAAAVESFGKAVLLPLDCLVGWLAMPGRKLRLFNRLSDTIVVSLPEGMDLPEDVEYVVQGE